MTGSYGGRAGADNELHGGADPGRTPPLSQSGARRIRREQSLNGDLSGLYRREDDEIRGAALQSLAWDIEVPEATVDVGVTDGWVTLTGDVTYQFESDAAFDDVASLYGVTGVTNEINVANP